MMQACVIAMSLLVPQVLGANLPSSNTTASPIPMPEDFTGYQVGKRTNKQTYKWTNKQTNKQTDKRTNKQTKTSTQMNKQTNKNLKNKQGAHENKQIGPLTILAGILLDPTHSQSTEVAS